MIKYQSPEIPEEVRKIIERDRKVMYGAHTKTPEIPLVVKRAKGCWIEDITGKKYLDLCANFCVASTGHCHPAVVRAIQEQAEEVLHVGACDFYHEAQIKLAEKLVEITPGNEPKKVFYPNTGAECLEATMKMAKYYTKRPKVISFFGAFHGRTYAGMTLSGSKKVQRAGFGPLIPEVYHTLYPYCYRCPLDKKYPECKEGEPERYGVKMLPCVRFLTDEIFERLVDPYEVAAIFVEPIQGEGGYIVPPPEFLKLLRGICDEFGIILIADEIQCGLGRTGKWWAVEHFGIVPDAICIAKGIASGIPMAAVIAKAKFMDPSVDKNAWAYASHGNTFGGNPVACAAALVTIELIEKEFMKNAKEVGDFIISELKKMQENHRIIGDVRGLGLMIGFELVKDKETKEPFPPQVTKDGKNIKEVFMGMAFKRGLIMEGCGKSAMRISPPLSITKEEAQKALEIIEDIITEIEKEI